MKTLRNDDYLMGTETMQRNGNGNGNGKTVLLRRNKNDNSDYVERELLRIVALNRKYDLQKHPEVLSGMLDELKKDIQSGDILAILKQPVVYGGIAAILSMIIIYKISKKKK